jgi:demethylmenaquinone methyltransferase/2-methoxy-6-polyprenyl-1,4-benzoquinol methylase
MLDIGGSSAMNTEQFIRLYRKRAKNYDWTANLYYLIGFREWRQRREAVRSLGLQAGDTVVEIGCGTGLNFGLLQEAVGASGKIIGVDATDAMLAQAERRVQHHNWANVNLVLSDAHSFGFPEGTAGVLSTYALSIIPNLQDVLERGAHSLKAGGRLSVLDLQMPARMPSWLTPILLSLVKPFGATMDWVWGKPWETIQGQMVELFSHVETKKYYAGIAYLITGTTEIEQIGNKTKKHEG